MSVGKAGVKPSHVRSLNALVEAHTLVKVKVRGGGHRYDGNSGGSANLPFFYKIISSASAVSLIYLMVDTHICNLRDAPAARVYVCIILLKMRDCLACFSTTVCCLVDVCKRSRRRVTMSPWMHNDPVDVWCMTTALFRVWLAVPLLMCAKAAGGEYFVELSRRFG